METAIVVLTRKGVNRILMDGGTSSWKLDPKRAGDCDYVVCTHNEGGGPGHGAAFLVLRKPSEIVPLPERGSMRYLVKAREYALVDVPAVWRGWRNPVHYTTMEDLGIDPARLEFKPMPVAPSADESPFPLSVDQAKAGLALNFGVAPSQIEIIIRA